jgi:hypothetical protein
MGRAQDNLMDTLFTTSDLIVFAGALIILIYLALLP